MRFRILGPMLVCDGTRWAGIGAAKCRSVLATLLMRRGEAVPFDQLVFQLWADTPPKSATTQVHGYVMRIRRAIGDRDGRLLVTAAPGYRLVAEPADVDAHWFEVLAGQGRLALRSGAAQRAADVLGEALDLWQGVALSDVAPTPLVSAEAERLAELRLAAWETRVDAELECGRHLTVIGELQRYVAEHPLREQPWRQLMLALHRGGRRAEALQAYRRLRATLIDELAVEPCAAIQQLHQEILAEGRQPPARPAEHRPVCQLPADVPDFTGRAEPFDTITDALRGGSATEPPPVVVVLGCPGIGKSTLAVHAARAVCDAFPDGQLYQELAGTSERPRDPADILADILRALGVTGAGLPAGLSARATLFRSMLAGRRMLLVLDDAASAEGIRPLIPPTGGCGVLVTSRRVLTGLAGALHVELDVFGQAEARQLLASVAGRERVSREPDEAKGIVRSCGYLPLAIRIAGGKLVARPAWSLRVLSERLANESRRLSELRLGELGVRASFDLSMRLLPDDAVLVFRLLGLLGPHSVPGWVAAALLGRPRADDVLDLLVDANLVRLTGLDAYGQPRYRLHDLLRTYAVEGATTIPARQRRLAVRRVLTTWLRLAEQAMDRMPRSFYEPTGRAATLGRAPVRLAGDPLTWFDAERTTLRQAVRVAVDWDMADLAWRLAATAAPYYDHRALHEDWRGSHLVALSSARAAGDQQGEANLLRGLAQVNSYQGNYELAIDQLNRSQRLFEEAGDKHGLGMTLGELSSFHRLLGCHETALHYADAALEMVAATEDERTEAYVRGCVARIKLDQGHRDDARRCFEEALALCRRTGDVHREGVVLREVSILYGQCGEFDRALASVRRALDIFENMDDWTCIAYTLLSTGRVHIMAGDREQAVRVLARAEAWFLRSSNPEKAATCRQLVEEIPPRSATTNSNGKERALPATFNI